MGSRPNLHQLDKKSWRSLAIKLSELKQQLELAEEVAQACGVLDPWVVGVVPLPRQGLKEAALVGVTSRLQQLDEEAGAHLNSLGGDVTDIELQDISDDHQFWAREGDVIYLLLGVPQDDGDIELYPEKS